MRLHRRLVLVALALAGLVSLTTPGVQAQGGAPVLVISQVYGAGGNAGAVLSNDYVELFNRGTAPAALDGLTLQYTSATGTGLFTVGATLSGSIEPGQHYLVQMSGGSAGTPLPTPDVFGTSSMAAGAGKVALVAQTTALGCNGFSTPCGSALLGQIIDLVGYGNADFFEGVGPAPTIGATLADIRAMGGCTDTDNNNTDFSTGAPAPRNSASPFTVCAEPMAPSLFVPVMTAEPQQAAPVVLTVTVTPGSLPTSTGLQVRADLHIVAVGGDFDQQVFDDGAAPDAVADDLIFTTSFQLDPSLGADDYPFDVFVTDGEGRSAFFTATLTVVAPLVTSLPHDIQGPGALSPLVSTAVLVEGVVTARKYNGFFVQTAPGAEDVDANTSEGLFVFTGSPVPASMQVGHLVHVAGTVSEYVPSADAGSPPMTELSGSITVTDLGVASLPVPVAITSAEVSPAASFDQLERFEGMLVSVASLTAVSGTAGSTNEANATGVSDGAFYAVITGEARPFREPGIEVPDLLLDCANAPGPCNIPRFDSNPERLRVDSDALDGAASVDVSTGAVITGVTGPLDYAFRTYTLLPVTTITPVGGMTALAVPAAGANQFTIASFNMERFFDTVNDPATSDVALTPAAYANRKHKASLAIRNILRTPDIVGVQEMENLTTLQDLASTVNADAVTAGDPSPGYAAYLVEGNDPGGIDVGFLVKTLGGRVNVASVEQVGFSATFVDPSDGSTDLLHDRPPLVLHVTVQGPATSLPASITVVNNHLRSLNGADDNSPTGLRVRAKRQAQAEFLASYIQGRQLSDPTDAIVSIGDYNAFSFNDGYGDSLGTIRGTPTPADQAVTASADLVGPDLVDLADFIPAGNRYSYVFGGNAQTLDHVLVTQNVVPQFAALVHARVNADFPEVLRGDAGRPERLSDHDPVVAYFTFPADTLAPVFSFTPLDQAAPATDAAGAMVSFLVPTATDNLDGDVPVACSPPSGGRFPLGNTTVTCTAMDVAHNTAAASFTVSVTDTGAPDLVVPSPLYAEAANAAGALVSFVVSATDAVDPSPAIVCQIVGEPSTAITSPHQFAIGSTMVTCTATDAAHNTDTDVFSVIVADTVGPVVGTVLPIRAEASSAAGAVVTFATPAAVDTVTGPARVTCLPPSGGTFPLLGPTTVVCSAQDTSGNVGSSRFTVTVADTTAPALTVPANISVPATSAAGAIVTFAATATDAVTVAPVVTCTPASGGTFPSRTTTVSCTARDDAGNTSASQSFTITVIAAAVDQPGRMMGGGEVESASGKVRFVFAVSESAKSIERGWLVLRVPNRPGRPDHFFAAQVFDVNFSDQPGYAPGHKRTGAGGIDTVRFSGVGFWNGGGGHTFEVTASDRGEPGRGRDTFDVVVRAPNGKMVAQFGGTLRDGNIQSGRRGR